ncbi:hypothetical protein QBC44DRAFT_42221 [Cladorrhinum sp. PSN332]|nr:hypothetical protein QBC44DRAFT_42221 [Cladorrhinum sp. PSN332]
MWVCIMAFFFPKGKGGNQRRGDFYSLSAGLAFSLLAFFFFFFLSWLFFFWLRGFCFLLLIPLSSLLSSLSLVGNCLYLLDKNDETAGGFNRRPRLFCSVKRTGSVEDGF